MTRGLAAAWGWRRAYWRRVSPGGLGAAFHLALPLLAFLPLESVPLVGDRGSGVSGLVWLLAVALGMGMGGGRGLREEDSVWLVQKGISLGEAALEDWILDLAPLAAASLWWAGVAALPLAPGVPYPASVPGWFLLGFLTSVLVRTLVGFLSAWGVRRPVDLAAVVVFLTLMAPLLLTRLPERVQDGLGWVVPPILAVPSLARGLLAGELALVVRDLLHFLAFTALLLGATFWRMERWRPSG